MLYDLSSSYLEGRCCEPAEIGYSRDGKPGKPQISYGLCCAPEGQPISIEVHAGPLNGLERAGLVSVASGALWFTHPLARSAAYAAGSAAERRAAHQALAGWTGGDRRAWHVAAAAFGVDEQAAAALEQAAEHARERSGFAAAAAALEQAARLSPTDADRARRLVAAADSARLAGRADDALRLLDAAQQQTPGPELAAASLDVRARAELARGRARTAHRLFARQAAQLSRQPRPNARPRCARRQRWPPSWLGTWPTRPRP